MHVLIATDGSERSVAAAGRASSLLGRPERVTLLTVLTEVPGDDAGGFQGSVYTPEEQERLWDEQLAEAGAELTRTAEALSSPRVERRIEVGDPASTICRVAEDEGVDVVVVGSHGHTGLTRLFLGSVSEHVVRRAPCPVLVVREPTPDDA